MIFVVVAVATLSGGCKNDGSPQPADPAGSGADVTADAGAGGDDAGIDADAGQGAEEEDGGEEAAGDDSVDTDSGTDDGTDDPVADSDTAPVITGIRFDFDSMKQGAHGSDNWALTWADDESQYASWGDGGGFEGTNKLGRVSLGLARIVGDFHDFDTSNVWGGRNALARATFSGKSYGVLAVGQDLWLWRTGNASDDSAFEVQDLFVSRDNGLSFKPTGVRFNPRDFPSSRGFFAPTFLQYGPGYRGALDDYVYVYAPEIKSGKWEVQFPGEIALMRVPVNQMANQGAYEFFGGLDSRGTPRWTADIGKRKPVFSDPEDGVMRTSVTYNAGLNRYLLVTQQRTTKKGGYIGIYEGPAPWGPWHTVLFENAWKAGLQTGHKSVYWNFSNKWTSADGTRSALVYTGPGHDNFGAVMATFETVYD